MAKFKSISELIETTGIDARAADCLGKSGALSSLREELNELEASEYSKEVVRYHRQRTRFKERLIRWEEKCNQTKQKYEDALVVWEAKNAENKEKYRERKEARDKQIREREEKNKQRVEEGKPPLKDIAPLKPFVSLKRPVKPKRPAKPSEPRQPILPRATLSTRERVKLQKEMTGIYFSGHPLDEIKIEEDISLIRSLSEGKVSSGSFVSLVGVLQSYKITNTRSKKLMARIRLEDKTGAVEVVLFPKTYEKLKGTLEKERIYKIRGRLDVRNIEQDSGATYSHTQVIGVNVEEIHVGNDRDWDILYPLPKGRMRVLPGKSGLSKGVVTARISNYLREAVRQSERQVKQGKAVKIESFYPCQEAY